MIELLFLSLTVEALQGKMCQNSLPSGVGRSLGAKISGGRDRPWGIFFSFYKTRHILLSNSANCRRFDNTGMCRTDGQTDGSAVASTALAMRALRRAVKIVSFALASKRSGLGLVTLSSSPSLGAPAVK